MRRLLWRALLLTAVTTVAPACDDNNNSSLNPTTPTTAPTVLTETFSGTLLKNAAYTHPFAVTDAGVELSGAAFGALFYNLV